MQKPTLIANEDLEKYSLEQKITFIAKISETIIENPEKNLNHLHSLLRLLKDSNFLIIKLTAISLAEIFKDIVPLYKIDKNENEEKLKQLIKKDERKIVSFEFELLIFYEKFFQVMNELKMNFSFLKRKQHHKRQTAL